MNREDWPPTWTMPAPPLPLLRAVQAAREPFHLMDVSVWSRRWTLRLPARQDVVSHLGEDLALGALPPRPLLKVFGNRAQLRVAIVSVLITLP